jgi:protein phosphatase
VSDEEDDSGARRRALSPVLGSDEFLPLSSTVKVEFGALSHPGKVRPVNTDHYLVAELGRHQRTVATSLSAADLPRRFDEYAYCMLVADGLGSSGVGALASRVAVATFAHLVIHFGKWNVRVDAPTAAEIMERAEWFYGRVHEAVVQRSRAHPILSGMATTLTGIYSAGDELFLVHVGHSRAYLFRDGELTQLSSDQTLAQRMAEAAGPAPVARATDDLRHILTETIGGQMDGPRLQIEQFGLRDSDRILLCTDGLTDMVDDDAIADVLTLHRDLDEQCQALVDLALRGGGQDNITAVLAQYSIPKA